jgi:hypothetical protein
MTRKRANRRQQADAGRDCVGALPLLELPEDALVVVLLKARRSIRALSCTCRQLNHVVSRMTLPAWQCQVLFLQCSEVVAGFLTTEATTEPYSSRDGPTAWLSLTASC